MSNITGIPNKMVCTGKEIKYNQTQTDFFTKLH